MMALPIIFVQVGVSDVIPYGLLALCTCVIILLNVLSATARVQLHVIALSLMAFAFVLYQVRPDTTFSTTGYFDAACFTLIVPVLFAASFPGAVNRTNIIQMMLRWTLYIGIVVIGLHLIGKYPNPFISVPYAGTRWVGGFDGPNEFGQFYVLMAALALGASMEGLIGSKTLFGVLSVCGTGIWHSYSRGALVALGIVLAVWLFLVFKRRRNRLKIGALVCLAICAALLVYSAAADQFFAVRQNATGRSHLFQEAFNLFWERPLFGGGFGTFEMAAAVRSNVPHSDILYFMVSGGIIAAAFLAYGFMFLMRRALRVRAYPELLFLIGFVGCGLTWNNLVRARLSIVFLIVLLAFLSNYRRLLSVRQWVDSIKRGTLKIEPPLKDDTVPAPRPIGT